MCVQYMTLLERSNVNWQETLADYRFSFRGNIMYYELYRFASG